ncbi:MAG: phospholipase D-like domain-containing protein [Myxococcota bacterium]
MRPVLALVPALVPALALALACQPEGETNEPAEPLRDPSGNVKLILNVPGGEAPTDSCDAEVCTALVRLLDDAERSIDFAVYGMRNQSTILEALKRAKARGVDVRGVVDRDAEGKNYYSSTEQWIEALGAIHDDRKEDVGRQKDKDKGGSTYEPKCPRPEGFEGPVQCLAYDLGDQCLMAAHASREPLDGADAIMHNKFFVVDSRFVWTGSTNVSDSGTGGYNANLVTVIDSRKIASAYLQEMDQMFVKGKYHRAKKSNGILRAELANAEVEVLFSPQDTPIRERVRPILKGAKESIDVAVFFLTHKHIAADLIKLHRKGVKVRVIIDATAAKNGYTKHELLRAAGIPVKVENWGGKMHMKSAVVDGKTVITGSMNWTTAGDDDNDENVVILHSAEHGQQYSEFFEEIWGRIDDRWLKENPDPESQNSGTACTDGVDNDFDHQDDLADAGCSDNPPPLPALPPYRLMPKQTMTCEW